MTDDGKGADETALDGIYSCSIPNISGSEYIIDVMATDVNGASTDDPPLIAATKNGGMLISHPLPNSTFFQKSGEMEGKSYSCDFTGEPIPSATPTVSKFNFAIIVAMFTCLSVVFIIRRRKN